MHDAGLRRCMPLMRICRCRQRLRTNLIAIIVSMTRGSGLPLLACDASACETRGCLRGRYTMTSRDHYRARMSVLGRLVQATEEGELPNMPVMLSRDNVLMGQFRVRDREWDLARVLSSMDIDEDDSFDRLESGQSQRGPGRGRRPRMTTEGGSESEWAGSEAEDNWSGMSMMQVGIWILMTVVS